jgi:hypothetical protein
VAGDFTGDGRTDLAVANSGSSTVSVLLGKGDGTFRSQATYAGGSFPDALVAGDFTGDGRIDLAVANSGSDTVSVLLGNGDGTFQDPVTYAAGSYPRSIVAGDFNGDGRADLAVANSGSDTVSVLLNLNGTFAPPGPFVTTPQATPLVANLTGDGVNDVLVVNAAGDILWRRGRPQEPGTFDPPITINPGRPSRDIVAVETNQGPVLASVDATDNALSLYAWRDGTFALIGSLPTGSLPAQIVTADLNGDGANDLVVRNAGDGTLSISFNTASWSGPYSVPPPPFLPAVTVPVGPGISDVTLADVSGDGRTDVLVTDKLTGEVGFIRNQGPGVFAPVVFYRAGGGLYAVTHSGGSASLTTLEATTGVAAGQFTTGGPADLVAINPGSNTVGVLSGLGNGRFTNPVTLPTPSPAVAVLVADLEGNGVPDMILLSAQGVTVYRGDGKGGFLTHPFTIDAGPDPTGMTLADVNRDGKLDLLVSNDYGDLLVLLGNGNGTFQPYRRADQDVALAVLPNGSPTPDFIFADQGRDRVVVDYSGGTTNVVADRSSGLLAPGAVVLADLNGDGIPDLIVADSGSNNVLVYPGLNNGQFGPELNGGHGFFTGTNPVSITVANLNGRPDLVITNQGSNDVSILLNEPTAGGGFTFVPGPRLQAGNGPTSTVVENVNGSSFPDLLVTDGGSNQVRLLPGVGGGFFIDSGPQVKVFPLAAKSDPVQVMVGDFLPNQGPEILTVNRGTNNVTVISGFNSSTPVFDNFPTGGIEPVEAIAVRFTGQSLESLVIANGGDGLFTLLGGAAGLEEEATLSNRELPEPTALVLASVSGDEVSFYATTAGMEAAFTLAFILPGFSPSTGPGPGSSSAITTAPAQLVPPSETALALVGTLLVTMLNTPTLTVLNPQSSAARAAAVENPAEVNTSFLSVAPSQGQGLFTQSNTGASGGDEAAQTEAEIPVGQGSDAVTGAGASAPPWIRSVLGVDEHFQQIREENQDALFGDDVPAATGASAQDDLDLGDPYSLLLPNVPTPRPGEPARGLGLSLSLTAELPHVDRVTSQAVDEVVDALASVPPISLPPMDSPAPRVELEPLPPDPGAMRSGAAVSPWVPVVIAFPMVVRAQDLFGAGLPTPPRLAHRSPRLHPRRRGKRIAY